MLQGRIVPKTLSVYLAPCTLHPAPCTLHLAPCTLHPAPCTLHLAPCTLHPAPCTLHLSSCTLLNQPQPWRKLAPCNILFPVFTSCSSQQLSKKYSIHKDLVSTIPYCSEIGIVVNRNDPAPMDTGK
jgi:hypothetical protein